MLAMSDINIEQFFPYFRQYWNSYLLFSFLLQLDMENL